MDRANDGGSHKPPYFVARGIVANTRKQQREFAPGTRVVVRSLPGVPNPYTGRLGEVVSSNEVDGQTAYAVMLDLYLPEEPANTPVEFLADELQPTHLPRQA